MTEPTLKCCPFCGGKAYIANPEPNALWRVICTANCAAGEYVSNRTAAIAAWNTRTLPANAVEVVARAIEVEYTKTARRRMVTIWKDCATAAIKTLTGEHP